MGHESASEMTASGKVDRVLLPEKLKHLEVLIVTLGYRLRLIYDGQDEEEDCGWCLGGQVQMFVGQLGGTLQPYGSIPDNVQTLFTEGWDWRRDDR
jgi:hypothetical protein